MNDSAPSAPVASQPDLFADEGFEIGFVAGLGAGEVARRLAMRGGEACHRALAFNPVDGSLFRVADSDSRGDDVDGPAVETARSRRGGGGDAVVLVVSAGACSLATGIAAVPARTIVISCSTTSSGVAALGPRPRTTW